VFALDVPGAAVPCYARLGEIAMSDGDFSSDHDNQNEPVDEMFAMRAKGMTGVVCRACRLKVERVTTGARITVKTGRRPRALCHGRARGLRRIGRSPDSRGWRVTGWGRMRC
jgi:hypothetical protein